MNRFHQVDFREAERFCEERAAAFDRCSWRSGILAAHARTGRWPKTPTLDDDMRRRLAYPEEFPEPVPFWRRCEDLLRVIRGVIRP